MCKRVIKYIITSLFVVSFLAPRVANLHALNHSEDDDRSDFCELCDIIAPSNQINLISDDVFQFEKIFFDYTDSYITIIFYDSPKRKIASPISIYNKPPPVS